MLKYFPVNAVMSVITPEAAMKFIINGLFRDLLTIALYYFSCENIRRFCANQVGMKLIRKL